jgi:PIN domain nuclease of toxin-antitoxin system
MNILLDTHIFIWFSSELDKVPSALLSMLYDPENELLLSLASIWEIQIKTQIGKLQLDLPLPELLEFQQRENDIKLLPIELD